MQETMAGDLDSLSPSPPQSDCGSVCSDVRGHGSQRYFREEDNHQQ